MAPRRAGAVANPCVRITKGFPNGPNVGHLAISTVERVKTELPSA